MPKDYKFNEIEAKWQAQWETLGINRYDWNDKVRTPFSIDTPPPYPSGELHMGNVLNWTYFDIVARFKRMQGYNVLFPQGWDCHGLGIEIQVEKARNIRKRDVPPEQFRQWCIELVDKYIGMMKEGILKLGASIDWSTEYKTMNPDYWRRTQLSFIELYKKGYMYQGTHPVNWCPRDETAIADAEVDHIKKEGTLTTSNSLAGSRSTAHAKSRPIHTRMRRVEVNPPTNATAITSAKNQCSSRTANPVIAAMLWTLIRTGAMQTALRRQEDVKTVIKHKLPVSLITQTGQ
jgi:isoleucyl-tRNA synthetase